MSESENERRSEALVAFDAEQWVELAAGRLADAIEEAVRVRGVARVGLSGGSSPGPVYARLAQLPLPWDKTEWFWVDERAVAPESPRANARAALEALPLEACGVPAACIHRMQGEAADLAQAASSYEAELRCSFGGEGTPRFDALVLGVGDDGHTASLFPGLPTVHVQDRWVVDVPAQPERGLEPRLSLTTPVLRASRLCLVLCRGASKRSVVAAARTPGSLDTIPARLLLEAQGDVLWLLDGPAAGER
jgi:6-phosphogluconolactonase